MPGTKLVRRFLQTTPAMRIPNPLRIMLANVFVLLRRPSFTDNVLTRTS
jgi:hypothetical protein